MRKLILFGVAMMPATRKRNCPPSRAGAWRAPVLAAAVALALLPVAVRGEGMAGGLFAYTAHSRAREPILPLPAPEAGDARVVDLGRRLFADPVLSADGTVSCLSCHDLARGGADPEATAVGIGGARGDVNTPTAYNTALNLAQFWDGRARTLEEQAGGPITNPLEMGSDWPGVLARLNASPYREDFRALFGGDATEDAVRTALAAYQRTLVTTGSRFDAWLLGDDMALTAEEREGYALFKSYGCASCHQGAAVGGNMFQRFGFFGNPFAGRGAERPADLGRYAVTGRDSDRYVFKVPSLRLAVLTAPYFHDGSVATLPDAVRLMGRYQLGHEIAEPDVALIVRFLGTLPGRLAESPP